MVDMPLELVTFIVYFVALLGIAGFSYRKQMSDTQFVIGDRSLNFWLTALSAHASDMSSWLFLAYPALIFTGGVFKAWAAVGLTAFMFLNWQFIAPRLRVQTEKEGSLTLSHFFEAKFKDTSGTIRLLSAVMMVLFYTIYISAGLYGLGLLVETLFHLNYLLGVTIGLGIVVVYVFMGGYRTVAVIDLFQGFFLLGVICFIPMLVIPELGGIHRVFNHVSEHGLSTSLLPNLQNNYVELLSLALGWGLGYFGQPHILTKFMGISRVEDMHKSKWVGISWQIFALGAATLVGLMGISVFPDGLADPQQVILRIVQIYLTPFIAGLTLCAILAATTNVMAAQILVVASSMAEDFYKRLVKKKVSSARMLLVSRLSVVAIGLVAYCIAIMRSTTIYEMVLYAWSGLGASFGPLLLMTLYTKRFITREGAIVSILIGGLTAATWPLLETVFHSNLQPLIPSFFLSLAAGLLVSLTRQGKS